MASFTSGAANSPAYFTDACNRMLHYEPEYDDKGNIIYEAPDDSGQPVLAALCCIHVIHF